MDKTLISRLTLGTAQLGLAYGINNRSGQPDQATAFAILEAALEGGITSFDTAAAYGSAEEVLGGYFAGKPTPFLFSKWFFEHFGPGVTADEVIRQLDEGLEKSAAVLGLSRLPGMMLHRPLLLQHHGREVTRRLRDYVEQGLIGHVGISLGAFVDREFEAIWPVIQDDLYELVQVPMNVFDHRLLRTGMLDKLQGAGKSVFARSAYLTGLLFLDDDRLPAPISDAAPYLAHLRRMAESEGMSVAELAFSYVRDLPGIDSIIVGAETPEQVRMNVSLLQAPALRESTRHEIASRFAGIREQIVTPAIWNDSSIRK
ncbi:aldo/keto reductase [Paenibacillus cymbidii]|uniref:aldo/keto reductase n=1 Tax=Paenibacillus cymbidii TaxID=1639034 RepID=UPI0010812567|nr:aldo/keto reductase [Paenibacillus cymbidii]